MYYCTTYASPVGNLIIVCDEEQKHIIGLWLEGQKYFLGSFKEMPKAQKDIPVLEKASDWLDRYFAGKKPEISELPLAPIGSAFRQDVWKILCEIPYGSVTTYGEIAKKMAAKMGKGSMSAQAVGGAVAHNPISIIIPCHRVVGTNKSLTGYAGGIDKKRKLLELEEFTMESYYRSLNISPEVYHFSQGVWESLAERFQKIDAVSEANQLKVLQAMQKNQVSEACMLGTTGYGYNDLGRDTLEKVYADIFHAEDALVRPQITCGTHALALALMSNLRPGDEILSPVGKPYDTLEEVIGIRPSRGSLAEYGITYAQVDLLADGSFDYPGIEQAINKRTRLVTIQRSKGYAARPTLSVARIGELISFIKKKKQDVICMVDNCYGEFVETTEPTDVGADMAVGSLIKNPGGGLAPIGGYIVGKKECVENAAFRLTSPGLGKEVGASLGILGSFYEGIFLAPNVTANALKGAVFAANIYEKLGFPVMPGAAEERYDIIQAVTFGSREALCAFCEGIQAASPVDSHVRPEPWAMPGYDSDVIMAAGAFVSGSSIELSADGPLKEPYTAYFQGGITWQHAKFGIMRSLQALVDRGVVLTERLK